ncbi:MAG: hypothetical protein MJ185_11770, partial [Treponema sp.]|nr:hypothetical protein [Treponema sp.]
KTKKLELSVNSIPLMNNVNNNDAKGQCTSDGTAFANCYNRLPNGDNNNNLDDDIFFDVWEFNDRVAKLYNEATMFGMTMKIAPSKKIMYGFGTSQKNIHMGTSARSSTYTARGNAGQKDYVVPSSVGFGIDGSGNTYACELSGEDTDYVRYFENGSEKSSIETVNGIDKSLKDQIHSPVFASGTNVYFAYFDKLANQIRFMQTSQMQTTANRNPVTGGNGNCQVIAGTGAKITADGTNDRGAGEYVSLAVSKNRTNGAANNGKDVVCAVWFNLAKNKVQYSYLDNGGTATKGPTARGWSGVQDIFTGGGQYCQIAVDSQGGVHIAADVGGTVQYAFAPSYNGTFQKVIVDVKSVGKNLTLDVGLENGRPVPVIGYMWSGKPKFAKLTDSAWATGNRTTWTVPAGVDGNRFTGKWDVTLVPRKANMTLNVVEKVNVGLWKTNAGVITDSQVASSTSSYTNTAETTCYSDTYGNGTSNAVLCYLTDDGANMETAQLR